MKRKTVGQLDVAMPGMTPKPGVDIATASKQAKEHWEKRVKEESGPMEKSKCTPMEYLLLFGQVPKLTQVQEMKPKDMTKEAAIKLTEAGCTRQHLADLYNMSIGKLYKTLTKMGLHKPKQTKTKEKATPKPTTKPEPVQMDKPAITWFVPQITGPMIAVSETGRIRINKAAILLAPERYHQSIRCRIGVNRKVQNIIIQPDLSGYKFRRNRSSALCCTSAPAARHLQELGVPLPGQFPATWNSEHKAWIGQLVKGGTA